PALPSIRTLHAALPILSEAFARTVTVAVTVAPLAGAVIATVGGVVSTFDTVTVTAGDVHGRPGASRASAVSVCEPLLAVAVFHGAAYGTRVTSTPYALS